MRIALRPTTGSDLTHVTSEPLPIRIRAITAVIPGDPERVLGVGGIGYRADGVAIGFAHFLPEMRRYPAAVHRAGLAGMRLIRDSGVARVIAEAQPGNAAAASWLLRFGFRPEGALFVWERRAHVE